MHTLDATDIRILQLLQHDAKIATKELADKLGKSVTPVHERIRKLEDIGYIKRYVARSLETFFVLSEGETGDGLCP